MENKRVIKLDSAENVRELGGYQTMDGHHVKWHKLLRSGSLGFINEKDLKFLENYGVRYDVDLRSGQEVKDIKDLVDGSKLHYIFDPVFNEDRTDNSQDPKEFRKIVEENPKYGLDHMEDVYRQMITQAPCRNAFHELFMILLENKDNDQSVLFHCTAGKDRTGMSAVFILAALGVDMETIRKDYIMTNEVVKDIIEKKVQEVRTAGFSDHAAENLRVLYSVNMKFLDAALEEIDKNYGTMQNFLHDGLDLTEANIDELKQLYLD
ncbi:tyrosine-protein phosphatase [Fructilactobacillus sp. Tb1]|uniref:tyrosine-protein phosphatase n=1 Tax=Fructilactobacillus sp. Tb1 TaxID=3422304 RepID=UPI003D2D8A1D